MNKAKLIDFIEASFLSPLLFDNDITDVSYNGQDIYYLHNILGRQKSSIIINSVEAYEFIRQIANLSEKSFSLIEPILDISCGRYRINAVHHTIATFLEEKTITFSIRLISKELKINDSSIPLAVNELFEFIIHNKISTIIAGATGSGKSELEKYIIFKIPDNERLIIIDEVDELGGGLDNSRLDINYWILSQNRNKNLSSMIQNALRSNPDWIIITESRGEEMYDILSAVMSGHPSITTIHAFDIDSILQRMSSMALMSNKNLKIKDLDRDLKYHFRFFVFMKREISDKGIVSRYISDIAISDGSNELIKIYQKDMMESFHKIPNSIISKYQIPSRLKNFKKTFVLEKGGKNE
jgi:pilus assembly protein CpaF